VWNCGYGAMNLLAAGIRSRVGESTRSDGGVDGNRDVDVEAKGVSS